MLRASTLFALAIAILLGLGVLIAARALGIFQTQPAAEKQTTPQVLVASQNLFAGTTPNSTFVKVRNLRQDELEEYMANRKAYLPPVPDAVNLRILAKNVTVDEPLRVDDFQKLEMPESISERLRKLNEKYKTNLVAVDLTLPKEQAAGGLIRTGEKVDVYLTTKICQGADCETKTARIARNLEVILKRNSLFTVMVPIKDNVNFVLAANPYRAALITFAKEAGKLSMYPTDDANGRGGAIQTDGEFANEELLVSEFQTGQLTVGNQDLMRIFKVRPPMVAKKQPPTVIEQISGISIKQPRSFEPTSTTGGQPTQPAVQPAVLQDDVQFNLPGSKAPGEGSSHR